MLYLAPIWFTIYSRILMPLSKPALGVRAIMAFAWNWNNFLTPLIYLNEPKKFTIAIGLGVFQRSQKVMGDEWLSE